MRLRMVSSTCNIRASEFCRIPARHNSIFRFGYMLSLQHPFGRVRMIKYWCFISRSLTLRPVVVGLVVKRLGHKPILDAVDNDSDALVPGDGLHVLETGRALGVVVGDDEHPAIAAA